MSRLERLIDKLKRRSVFRVAVVYAVVAFVIWQAAEIAFPALNLPAWALTLVVVLTLIGFPMALVLAWALEITPEGIRRTEPVATSGTYATPTTQDRGESSYTTGPTEVCGLGATDAIPLMLRLGK